MLHQNGLQAIYRFATNLQETKKQHWEQLKLATMKVTVTKKLNEIKRELKLNKKN